MDQVTIGGGDLTATIAARGAELQSLIPAWGDDVIWSADRKVWAWHAPNLFPIIGALPDDRLVHDGNTYPMKQHGFLRYSLCEIVSAEADACAFRLRDNEETRIQYPFAFELTVAYRVASELGQVASLHCAFTLHNPGAAPLPASIGAHPAFRWPLGDSDRAAHIVRFEKPEPEPIRRLDGRLIGRNPEPTPVEGRVLRLTDALFDRDALIFDRLASRSLVFGAPGGRAIALAFPDFPQFGIWTKPGGAHFLCLEPWQGMASPEDFTGDFADKPGVVTLAPGEIREWRYTITPVEIMPENPGHPAQQISVSPLNSSDYPVALAEA